MNYSDMSDFEVNKAVAEALGLKVSKERYFPKYECVSVGSNPDNTRDYCNNPSDAWPIIVENRIGASPLIDTDVWYASWMDRDAKNCDNDVSQIHTNPLRAAMIVFLMMKEQGK